MSIGKIKEFDIKNGTWSAYIERMEMYFKVNNVKSELHLPTLIATVGDEAYELITNLTSPKKPSELTYDEIVTLVKDHLQPAPSVLAERYRFRQKRQGSECLSDYVAELKKAARFCKFESALNDNLRDQFVCGIKSDEIRQRLFAEDDDLSFTNAVKKATTLEAAIKDSAAVDVSAGTANNVGTTAGADAVHAINAAGDRRINTSGYGGRGGNRTRGARGRGGSPWRSAGGGAHHCGGCGGSGHTYQTCKFRSYECSRYRRMGHLRRVCPELMTEKSRADQTNFHQLCGKTDKDKVDELPLEPLQEEDFHHLCLRDYPLVRIPVSVNNRILSMEVDTGAAAACISSETYDTYFRDIPLLPPATNFTFYDGTPLNPVGMIKPKVRYGVTEKELELFVIKDGKYPIIGRHWLTELKTGIAELVDCHNLSVGSTNVQLNNNIKMLCDRYKELFEGGLGRYTGGKATLRLRPGTVPVFHRARPLPYALRARVDAELDAMLRDGIIESVDCSDWASRWYR
ncbi:uncharacterized protein LOC125241909 [Leguminivora glycinivorella]|uniref:uncharacterized protein LOC125241909 n=1 Tax=Leguminivora glycinivorella TaxID=1035111 RepID=UPI00201033EB|nr:uncharacterized protein LOC125241909 [Leguminivora glycinivorella]